MNCEQFENLLADVLGDEPTSVDRQAFDEHVRTCERCRHEYESMSGALAAMRSLSAPLAEAESTVHRFGVRSADDRPAPIRRFRSQWIPLLRYAAVVGIAFVAGYLFRAEQRPHGSSIGERTVQAPSRGGTSDPDEFTAHRSFTDIPRRSFESALAGAHLQKPSRSDLAKCMIAMFQSHR